MRKLFSIALCAALVSGTLPSNAPAAVNVERHGTENPVVEVFKSTCYGALAGMVVGGAIALAAQDENATDDIMRWSIVAGTMVGLGAGIWFVSKRPQPSALLEIQNGSLGLHAVTPELQPGGGVAVRLAAVRF